MADAEFIFATNISEVAAAIARGSQEIESIAARTGKSGAGVIAPLRGEVDQVVGQARARLEQLTTAFGRGQQTGNFSQAVSEQVTRPLAANLERVIADGLRRGTAAGLPTSDLTALGRAFSDTAFGGLKTSIRQARSALAAPTTAGGAGLSTAQIGRSTVGLDASNANKRLERLYADLGDVLQSDLNALNATRNANVQSAEHAKGTAAATERQARAANEGAKSAEDLATAERGAARNAQQLAQDLREGRARLGLTKNGTRNSQVIKTEDGQFYNYRTGAALSQKATDKQLALEQKFPQATASLEAQRRDKERGIANALDRHITAEQRATRIRETENDVAEGRARRLAGLPNVPVVQDVADPRRLRNLTTGQDITRDSSIDQLMQRSKDAVESQARAAENRTRAETARNEREERQRAQQAKLEEEITNARQQALALARGEYRQVTPTLGYNKAEDRFYTTTQRGQGLSSRYSEVQEAQNRDRLKAADERAASAAERRAAALERQAAADARQNQGLGGAFLGGLTSRGFGGGQSGFSGSFTGLAATAGITAKYAATSAVLFGLTNALQQAITEYGNFEDSQTELKVALDSGTDASGAFVNSLTEVAAAAGANVGDAMDVAASGIRAFRDQTDGSKEAIEGLGTAFDTQAARIAVLGKTTLADAAGNLKATALSFDIAPTNAGFARVTDALVGAKEVGGGNEKDISQAIASGGQAAKQAGFTLNEFSVLASRVQAQTDQSGTAIGQSFSRMFSIIGGSQGRNAIRNLNSQLSETSKVDLSAPIRDQVLQLSRANSELTDQQRSVLVNALGGTANPRQFSIILSDASKLINEQGDGLNFAGKGAEEYNLRLKDVTKTLLDIQGRLRAIVVNIANSGLAAPIVALIKALDIALKLASSFTGIFQRGNSDVKAVVASVVALLGAIKLVQAISRAGGVGSFLQSAERRVAPTRALARSSLRQAQDVERTTSRATEARTAVLATPLDARASQATEAVRAGATLIAEAEAEAAVKIEAGANAIVAAENRLAVATATGGDTAAARAELRAAQETYALAVASGASDVRAANLLAAEANRAAVIAGAAAAAESQRIAGVRVAADAAITTAMAEETAIREVNNARLRAGTLVPADTKRLVDAQARTAGVIARQDARLGAAALGEGAAGAPPAPRTAREVLRLPAREGLATTFRSAGAGLANFTRGLNTSRVEYKEAFALAQADIRAGASRLAATLNAVAQVGGPTAAGQAAARRGAEAAAAGSKFFPTLGKVGSGALSLVGGPLGLALGAGFLGYQGYNKNKAVAEGLDASTTRIAAAGQLSSSDITELRETVDTLRSGAADLTESTKGITATVTNAITGKSPENQVALENSTADRVELAAKQIEAIQKSQAQSNKPSELGQLFDLSSETGVADGLQLLTKSGRDAETQSIALSDAISHLADTAADGTARLSEQEKVSFRTELTNTELGGFQEAATLGNQKERGAGLFYNPFGASARRESQFREFRNLDLSPLGTQLDNITKDVLSKGGDPNDPKTRRALVDAQKAAVDAFLKRNNIDDPDVVRAIDSEVAGSVGQTISGLAGKQGDSKANLQATIDKASQFISVLPTQAEAFGQQKQSRAALRTSGFNTVGGGEGVVAAQASVDYLKTKRIEIVAQLVKAGASQKQIDSVMEQLQVVQDQQDKALQSARLDRKRTVFNYRLNRPVFDSNGRRTGGIAASDTVGRLQATSDEVQKEMETATGDAYEKLQDEYNQLQPQINIAKIAQTAATALAAIDPRQKVQVADQNRLNAEADLKGFSDRGDTTSTEAQNAYLAVVNANLAEARTVTEENNLQRDSNVAVGDSLGEATAAYQDALDSIHLEADGTPEKTAARRKAREAFYKKLAEADRIENLQNLAALDSRDTIGNDREAGRNLRAQRRDLAPGDAAGRATLDRQIQEQDRKTLEDRVTRQNSRALSRLDPRDAVGRARQTLTNDRRLLALQLRGSTAYNEAYAKVQQDKLDLAEAQGARRSARRGANTDSRDTVGTARNALSDARENLARQLVGSTEYYTALKEVFDAQVALARTTTERTNAIEAASVFPGSDLQSARAALNAATRNLRNDEAGTTEYFNDLATLHQAQQSYAEALRKADETRYLLSIDITDPVAQAASSLRTATNKLNQDTKAGAPKDVLDQDRLGQREAANALEAAQFDARINDWDVADRLGRITHDQHLKYLQGEHDRLSAIVNRTYQQQQELNQVDLALQDMKDNINSAVSGQFNLGDIKVPTVYEVRRAIAVGTGNGGTAGGGTVNNNNTVVTVNGADFAKVVQYLQSALGISAQVTRTNGGRK